MGWIKVDDLEVYDGQHKVSTPGLWTRGGLEGVEVRFDDKFFRIKRSTLINLLAQELIDKEIAKLEQMEGEEAIEYLLSR